MLKPARGTAAACRTTYSRLAEPALLEPENPYALLGSRIFHHRVDRGDLWLWWSRRRRLDDRSDLVRCVSGAVYHQPDHGPQRPGWLSPLAARPDRSGLAAAASLTP